MELASPELGPLPYHSALHPYLQQREPEVLRWLQRDDTQEDQQDEVRLNLLKSTIRLDPETHPRVYAAVQRASEALNIHEPVTVYQAHGLADSNACILVDRDEAHIVSIGRLLSELSDEALLAVIAHELGHLRLYRDQHGAAWWTERALHMLANGPHTRNAHMESERLLRLYTEVYADRASLVVCRDPAVVIAALIRSESGLDEVNVAAYIKQADELLAKAPDERRESAHPELAVRTRVLLLWAAKVLPVQDPPQPWRAWLPAEPGEVDAEIAKQLEGPPAIDRLDLLAQERLAELTRAVIETLLTPVALRTDVLLAHARMFFRDISPGGHALRHDDPAFLASAAPNLRDYIAYLLLDFIAADSTLEEYPLVAALKLATELNVHDELVRACMKELKLRKRDLTSLTNTAEEKLAAFAKTEGDHA